MSFAIRQAWSTDLDRLVELAVRCQGDPERVCPQLSSDAAALRTELIEIDGTDDWSSVTWVALDDARELMGWIAAESDTEIGRIWWLGPFIDDATSPLADAVADGLLSAARSALPDFGQHQVAADRRSSLLARFATRNGFVAGVGSAALCATTVLVDEPDTTATITAAGPSDADAADLHDRIFPGTHSTGSQLFAMSEERHDRFVARIDDVVVGYIATELQHDGSLYIDYVGVDVAARGRGVGAALVATAMRSRASEATHVHLTVRESNISARRLYASLGFTDDIVIIPYRFGFTLD